MDKNCSHTEKNPSDLIRKIVPLLEHQITQDDVERHTEMISTLVEVSQHGFLIRDLPHVTRLIDILSERIDVYEIYEKLLEQILCICRIPPLLTKSSDVLTFASELQEMFSVLGFLLICLKRGNLRDIVVDVLAQLLKKFSELKWYSSLEFRRKAADNSRLPEILAQLLATADDELYPKLLTLIILITKDCRNSYKILLHLDAMNSLLRRIEPTWKERYPNIHQSAQSEKFELPHYDNTIFIFCQLLDYLDKNRKELENVRNIERFSMWNIQYVFHAFIASYDKQLDRNNIVAIIMKLMDLFPNSDEFVASGLCEDVINISMYFLFQLKSSWSSNVKLTASENDYNFIKLLLLTINMVAKQDGGVRILEDARIIYRLLKTINYPGTPLYFSEPHSCVIQIFCWTILKKLIPYTVDEFIENSGPSTLLNCMNESRKCEEGISILVKCLETTNYILKFDPENVISNSLVYNGGINTLLDLCKQFLLHPVLTEPIQGCVSMVFCILTKICQNCSEQLDKLVKISIKYIERILNPNLNETIYDNKIIICLMEFVWEIVIKSENLCDKFIKQGGVYLILNIIQQFPFPVQLLTLGALVDLCEDESCVPYLITWTGLKKVKLIPLLMRIFRHENEKLRVKSGKQGQILDSSFPIMGQEQWIQTFCDSNNVFGHPAISDLFLSCRPKIYAILKLLNERHREILEIADERYKTNPDELTAKDQVTILLADNFLALKLGEAWVELKMEFNKMEFTPIPSDQKVISTLVTKYHRWGEFLKKTQYEILEQAKVEELIEEQKLYNILGESRIKEALEALDELKYIARSTERMFRISQKYKQLNQIEKSLKKIIYGEFMHKTYLSSVAVTAVFNHDVSIEREKMQDFEELINPVSPRESDVEYRHLVNEDLLKSDEFQTISS